jgi:DNA-binding GntR family transcriptional regulator
VTHWTGRPVYLQIAGDYRADILNGTLPAGAKLPSESELMRQYAVSRIVAKMAISVLRNEGLIVSHQGKGSFVKEVRRIIRDSRGRYLRNRDGSTSPFRRDTTHSGQRSDWEYTSEEQAASAEIAQRLRIEFGAPVMRTGYRFFANSEPIQLSTSWEPLALTRDTPVMYPEDGEIIGVIARMDHIGQHVDSVVERVTARAAYPDEATALQLPQQGAYILLIQRTHYVGSEPVETCDIIFPGDRYELTYHIPVA